jgi:hypothetical protein
MGVWIMRCGERKKRKEEDDDDNTVVRVQLKPQRIRK